MISAKINDLFHRLPLTYHLPPIILHRQTQRLTLAPVKLFFLNIQLDSEAKSDSEGAANRGYEGGPEGP